MAIQASDVKKLRDKTGAGMMECKKALQEADGDFDKAEKILKELGLAAAAKRSDRATNEGRVFTKVVPGKAGILEMSCETDFVGMNTDFVALGESILDTVIEKKLTSVTDDIENQVKEAISKLKENLAVRRFEAIDLQKNETAVDYIHGEGRIGVVIVLSADKPELLEKPEVKEMAFDCALHVAAFNPKYLSRNDVPKTYLNEQEGIFTVQAQNLGKPEKVIQGIVKGKLNKHLSEICFLNQPFVKDDKVSVEKKLEEISKAVGGKIDISGYKYYSVGEDTN